MSRTSRQAGIRLVLVAGLLALLGACKKPAEPASAAEVKDKLQTGVTYALWKVDASDDQKRRFDALLDGLSVDLFALQQESTGLKRRTMTALDAPAVDPAELEGLRSAAGLLFGRYLARMARAAEDAAAILTAEQRHKVVGLWREWEFGE